MEKLKRKKYQKGITLIALVITIIVLVILAGVTISALSGDNGILTNASKSKIETENANKGELRKLAMIEASSNIENRQYIDSNGDKAIIPAGFAISSLEGEQLIDTGLVVLGEDGSEFVWVPVSDINSMAQCREAGGNCHLELNENGLLNCTTHNSMEIVGKLYATSMGENFGTINTIYKENSGFREPALISNYDNNTTDYNIVGLTLNELNSNYKEMSASVAKNGGFYVGRYETSLASATETEAGSIGNAQSKIGVIPLSSNNSAINGWYGLYDKSKSYTVSKNSVQSSMIWGSQYDAMLNWALEGIDAEKVTKIGIGNNSSGILSITGNISYGDDNINNILDLGGNLREWTLEASGSATRVYRGGSYNTNFSPSLRNAMNPLNATLSYGSRLTLYIK